VANVLGINKGITHTTLNDLGRQQAQMLARRLIGFHPPIEAILCSDLDRAISTAAPISEALQLPINIDPRWRERCYGIFQGCNAEQRDALRKQHNLAEHDIPPGAQTLEQYYAQVLAAFLDAPKKFPEAHCIAVVTHGGACRAVLALLADGRLPMRRKDVSIPVDYTPNCSITHVTKHDIDGEISYDLMCSHEVGHLAGNDVTRTDNG
jgi:probable phosphoglycerate mutase